jgi:hypothetical protein
MSLTNQPLPSIVAIPQPPSASTAPRPNETIELTPSLIARLILIPVIVACLFLKRSFPWCGVAALGLAMLSLLLAYFDEEDAATRFAYPIIILGGFFNFLAVVTNHGHMPVLISRHIFDPSDAVHSILDYKCHFKFLCDILPIPPLGIVGLRYLIIVSPGDLILVTGALLYFLISVFSWRPQKTKIRDSALSWSAPATRPRQPAPAQNP